MAKAGSPVAAGSRVAEATVAAGSVAEVTAAVTVAASGFGFPGIPGI